MPKQSSPLAISIVLLLFACVNADYILPVTENCGPPQAGDANLYFQTQEFGYDALCWKYKNLPVENRTQIFVQLYKPPTLPYQIEEVCGFMFIDHEDFQVDEVRAEMFVYSSDPTVDFTKELPRPYELIGKSYTYVINPELNATHARRWWYSARLANPITIWNETVFVGFGWDPCEHVVIWRNYARPGEVYNSTPWYLRPPGEDKFVLHTEVTFNDRDFDRRGSLAITTWGGPAGWEKQDLIDAGWTCDPSLYNNGVCNCGCGLDDPDCLGGRAANAQGCATGGVCLYHKCVYPMWDSTRCDITQYHDGENCTCGCGGLLKDPDCFDAGRLPACRVAGAVCDRETMECVGGWTCEPYEYGDGVCTCRDCGIEDPDCADAKKPNDCSGEFAGFVCVNSVCKYPANYTCPGHTYNDGRTCNCGCGVPDPDCETIYSSIVGCPMDDIYSCSSHSVCIPAVCGNQHVDLINYEECDGGLGCTECRCVEEKGYKPTDPPSESCVPICGDGRVREPEECEKGYQFCNTTTCRCEEGHPYNPEIQRCSGCGNNQVEPNNKEECDGGEGCTNTCVCDTWYVPFDPPQRGCQQSGAVAGVIVGCILAAVILVTVVILLVLYFKKWRSVGTRQPSQGSDVVIMQVDEDGMIKVSTQSTGGKSGPAPGSIAPGTVQGLQANALASGALQSSTTMGTGMNSTDTATMTATATTTQAPPEYSSLAETQAAGGVVDSSLAATMAFRQPAATTTTTTTGSSDDENDYETNPALAQTMFMN